MNDLNYLGTFDSITDVWKSFPHGGLEGDYLHIGIVKYRWNKYDLIWENARTYTESISRERTNFDGDVSIQNDLTVAGCLRAQRVKQPNCGLFKDEASLKKRFPNPDVGMWAVIGDTIPGDIWRCDTQGIWTATGESGGIDSVDLNNYYTKNDVDYLHRSDIDLRPKGRISSFRDALSIALTEHPQISIGSVITYMTPSTEEADSIIQHYIYYTDEYVPDNIAAWINISVDEYKRVKEEVDTLKEQLSTKADQEEVDTLQDDVLALAWASADLVVAKDTIVSHTDSPQQIYAVFSSATPLSIDKIIIRHGAKVIAESLQPIIEYDFSLETPGDYQYYCIVHKGNKTKTRIVNAHIVNKVYFGPATLDDYTSIFIDNNAQPAVSSIVGQNYTGYVPSAQVDGFKTFYLAVPNDVTSPSSAIYNGAPARLSLVNSSYKHNDITYKIYQVGGIYAPFSQITFMFG